ncbi:MAG: SpoIIE family protein phosphatase [Polyangiaceae bacterium]|jgi:sigma-B regulation protein RsbU (phosphoserine phosphatase)|nr:SpoIIE family protein phosphatase [Polyangiaceae bacterium]MBK8940125.1 SpoIIE family protein phosphatase [Polyangiaceae bacterium]
MRRPTEELRLASAATGTGRAWVDVDLEVENGGVQRKPRATLEQHTVIGRTPGLALTLDHDTVSRKHAEIFCDPFGRWWIRDLGSTNGTSVNDERVRERVLRPGDRIGVGDYRLRFHMGSLPEIKAGAPSLEDTLDGTAAPSWMRTLRDVDPPQISATHLSTLMALSRRMLGMDQSHERLEALCDLLVSTDFHATAALVVRIRAGDPSRILAGPKRPPHVPDEPPYVSRTVLRQAVLTQEAVLGTNLPQVNPGLELTLSADVSPLATVAVPIHRDETTTDILYCNLPPHYGRSDWLALIALAGEAFQQSEIAWSARRHAQQHAAIERELETARIIQHALVPKSPRYPGLEIAIDFDPCRWVGGDYVDTVTLADGRILCTVADVCGKGLQAALVTFSIHTMIRALSDHTRTVPEILDRLNRHLCEYLPDDSFVTMVSCAIDPKTGEMEYVNAGHPPAFVFDDKGGARALGAAENAALGLTPCSFSPQRDRIEPGEILLCYTDGLTELKNSAREMLGEDQLRERFTAIYRDKGAESIDTAALGLKLMLDEFRGDELPEDDRAFLLARRPVLDAP